MRSETQTGLMWQERGEQIKREKILILLTQHFPAFAEHAQRTEEDSVAFMLSSGDEFLKEAQDGQTDSEPWQREYAYYHAALCFDLAANLAQRSHDTQGRQSALDGLAKTFRSWGDNFTAVEIFLEALGLLEAGEYPLVEANLFHEIALTYLMSSQTRNDPQEIAAAAKHLKKAKRRYARAIEMLEEDPRAYSDPEIIDIYQTTQLRRADTLLSLALALGELAITGEEIEIAIKWANKAAQEYRTIQQFFPEDVPSKIEHAQELVRILRGEPE